MDGCLVRRKILIICLFMAIAVVIALTGEFGQKNTIPIMMYHHVSLNNTTRPDTVSPQRFRWQMAYLKANHFHVLSLSDYVRSIQQRKSLPERSVIITFDDGYEDNYTYAFPVLKEYGFSAMIFVISDSIDTLGFLSKGQLKEMITQGIEIGSHTRRHAYLPRISENQLVDEIAGSKKKIEDNLGIRVIHFCYPSGGFNENVKKIVRESGYMSASTTNRGYDQSNRDVYEIKRIRFSNADFRATDLWMKFTGIYNLFRKEKNPD